jgi:hypothetical protein
MLSWKAELKGPIFCAPACGNNCTLAAYKKAKSDAKKCLRQLKYKGFKINVWENVGWHWELYKGGLHLYNSGDNFFTLLSECGKSGGHGFWNTSFRHKDPNKVITDQLKAAKSFIKKCSDAVKEVEA